MSGAIDARLSELGVTLPDAPAPAANYVPWTRSGAQVFVSGQLSMTPEGITRGLLGDDMDVAAGAEAAKLCAVNLLAQLKAACEGDLDRVTRVVKLTCFVNSAPGFSDQPKVANGCSDFLVEVFGERGRHARSAVGASLPFGAAVEIEGIFEIG